MRMPRLTSQPASAASSVFGRTPTRYDQNIEVDFAAALEVRLCRLELRHRVAEQELYALALDVLLDDGRRDLGQNVRQDARREVDDGQLGNTLVDALGALQADEAAPTMSTRLSFLSPSISFRCFASSSVMKLVLFSTVSRPSIGGTNGREPVQMHSLS